MSSDFGTKAIRIIKAIPLLKAKVGYGPNIDEKKILRSQQVIDQNAVDFPPLAQEYLDQLEEGIKAAQEDRGDFSTLMSGMTVPVMQIKANASMFGYALAGQLATIMLNFLESLEAIDGDVIDIALAHHKTITTIVHNKMAGDGGDFGQQLETELKEACNRYYKKNPRKPAESSDAFFID